MIRHIQEFILLVRVCWRHLRGRWFVFRNEPTWFVEMFAEQDLDMCKGHEHEADMRAMILEARAELKLRERRA